MPRFDLFVVLAEMRTGSNFLEANLNALPGLRCHGEAFNPHFPGYPDRPDLLGVPLERREADPGLMLRAIRVQEGLNGFRFFSDHDPRALDMVLPDPRVAKVVLTRNPVESWVSRRIAAATGQWKLTNAAHARSQTVRFDPADFAAHLDRLQAFQLRILRGLQVTGQTAFYVDYEDIQDLDVMRGLAAFLGVAPPEALDRKLKKQNPEPLSGKVANFAQMEAALGAGPGGLDRFDLSRTPSFEPRRGAGVPQMLAAPESPLLFLPIRSGPETVVRGWLADLDASEGGRDGGRARVVEGFTHGSLRAWKALRPGHLSFTVLRHPIARAHVAFCERILSPGPDAFGEMRANLRRTFALPVPEGGVDLGDPGWDAAAHRAAFARFLEFLKANLGGQTSLRVDPAWASQLALVQGFSAVNPPDLVLREAGLAEGLDALARRLGRTPPPLAAAPDALAARLGQVYDAGLEALAREACGKDYGAFGFGDWRPGA